jgi:polyphosphate kinase 2 (PPK2 family)
MDFIVTIIGTAEVYCIKVPTVRKPRKKKEKPASKIVTKVKVKDEDKQYKIKSIKATDIVGAQQLWLFNTKYRVLTVLNAMGAAGLSVKGTTVINFDEKTSQTKTLRKPELSLATVMTGGKIALKKLMDTIKCNPKKVTGRINTDIVILRAIK